MSPSTSEMGSYIPWRERPTLRLQEAADIIGISRRSLGRMIEAGDLECRTVGSIKLVVTQSIRAWIGEIEGQKPQGSRADPALVRAAGRWMKGNRA